MTPEEQVDFETLKKAVDEMAKGFCDISVAYNATRILNHDHDLAKIKARMREIDAKADAVHSRLEKASVEFTALRKAVRSVEQRISNLGAGDEAAK